MKTHHMLPAERLHDVWNNALPPVLTIDSGDTVTMQCVAVRHGYVTADTPDGPEIPASTWRGHPLTGPVYIRGARPGDTLAVHIEEIRHHGWGFTYCRHGMGLLEDFGPRLKVWHFDGDWAEFRPGIRVPIMPFLGVMGLAPAEPGEIDTAPPGSHGGNLDIRHLTKGATLYLPVAVEGALFSAGDGHAAQGDGEVCITAIEAPLTATLRFEVLQGKPVTGPAFVTPGPLVRACEQGYHCTTGIGPDLHVAAQNAIRSMIAHVEQQYGLDRDQAYMLCSVVVDLKISEIVNRPNWVVTAYLPLGIFAGA
ncbi:MAG TPA: acetamidase/formamidase family protein [Symbiobacteriaceae bacterium]|nr:acetamidase/formamidase family protein [Symbiobacteriaceae bacterium]